VTSTCTAFGGSFRLSHWTIIIGVSSGASQGFSESFPNFGYFDPDCVFGMVFASLQTGL